MGKYSSVYCFYSLFPVSFFRDFFLRKIYSFFGFLDKLKGRSFAPPLGRLAHFLFFFLTCKKIKPPMIKATSTIATMVFGSISYDPPSSFS